MRSVRLCGKVGQLRNATRSSPALLRGLVAANHQSLPALFSRAASSLAGLKEPLEDILRKAQYRQVTDALDREDRVRMPLTDYLALCKRYNVAEAEAGELLKALHKSGRVLHYENSPELANTVIVRPDALAASFVKLLDVQGEYTKSYVQAKQQELASLQQELQTLEATYRTLQDKAYSRADNWIRLGFAYIVVQAGLVARLTWWELSWDIMEPVTYMLTFATAIGGMAFFVRTKSEYTYEGLRTNLADGRLKKLFKKHNFDLNRYEELKRAVEQAERDLKTPETSLLNFQTLALQ